MTTMTMRAIRSWRSSVRARAAGRICAVERSRRRRLARTTAGRRARGRCGRTRRRGVRIEKSSARSAPAARSAAGERVVAEHVAERGGERVGVARLDEQRRRRRRSPRCGSRRGRWRRPGCRPPSPRSARRRTTRRAATARRTPTAPRRRANFSASLIRPSHADAVVVGRAAARRRAVSGPSLAIHSRTSRASAGERLEQHGEALALLVAAAEEDRRVGRRRRRGARRSSSISTPLNRIVVLAAEVRLARARGRPWRRRPCGRCARRPSARDRPEHLVAGRAPGGVERADDRRRVHQQRRHRRTRAPAARGRGARRTPRR